MRDSLSRLPPEASARVARCLEAVDARMPGQVEAVWVEGSIALGDFQPRVSDIDLVFVTRGEPPGEERRRIEPRGRPAVSVSWLTWDSLATLPVSGDLGVVTAATLHRHGIAVRGPEPATMVSDVDRGSLVTAMLSNLESYWIPWLHRARQSLIWRVATLHPRLVEWGVLGVPRQYVSVVEGEIVSKSAAGRYVRERFDARWRRVVDEALRLRASAPGAHYASPFERRRDMLAFLEHAIERTRDAARAARRGDAT